jgi:hypothetical protein
MKIVIRTLELRFKPKRYTNMGRPRMIPKLQNREREAIWQGVKWKILGEKNR